MSFSSLVSAFFARFFFWFAVLVGLSGQSHGYTHPCIPTTLQELDTIKANLDKQPWKAGYAKLAATSTAKLNWTMAGPYVNVSRAGAYDQNLVAWQNSMNAVYNLSRMWYFTGNEDYAKKAHDILLAWATTHTSFTGNESGLALGDHALALTGGASILRGTWPGWTPADTATVKNYFANVLWPASGCSVNVLGPANKGAIYMQAGIGIAVFCDDTAKFDHIIRLYRTFHGSGLMDTLPTGQMGETGRDAGHAYGMLNGLAFTAEVAWKQGVDLFSELDNRLLACGEYYARNTFTTDNPFVPSGSIDWQWIYNNPGPYLADRSALYIFQNAYKNRKGLPTPWIDRKLQEQGVDTRNFMFAKTADFTTATVTPTTFPTVSPASSGLTLTTLGTRTAGRSATYSDGVWTLSGLGNSVWNDTTDDCQFAYKQMTGDCAMVAKVISGQFTGAEAKLGLMIRDTLTGAISQRAWVGFKPDPTALKLESHMRGWTDNWGGTGYDDRSHDWMPAPVGLPYWIKIERLGSQITTFTSVDGASWAPVNCSYYGNLPSTLYIGLFVCSGSTTTAQTATFTNVAFTGGAGGLVVTPAAPAGVLASGSNKSISLRWLGSFGATSYDVLRSTTSGSGYTAIASNLTASKTSYVDTAVTAGTTYYYVVRAKNFAGTSGDSPPFSTALLPSGMVNIAFSGTPSASANNASATEGSPTAFDSDPSSKWFNNTLATGWLQYDFGAGNAQVVRRYSLTVADVANRDPKNWNFLGSQDGTTWTTLDSQSNQAFGYRQQQNFYNIGNSTGYRYYRIEITANNGGTNLAVADLGLWSDIGRTIQDGTYRFVSRKSNKVMDISNAANSSQVIQQTFEGGDTQQWTLTWQGNGSYLATNVSRNKALDIGSALSAGASLAIQSSGGGIGQQWKFTPDGDGFFRLESTNNGLVADISNGSTTAGANIVQSLSSGKMSQQWMPAIASARQPTPAAPANLAATAVSLSQIDLTWTASPGAVSYNLKRATASGGPYTTVFTGLNGTAFSDTTLSRSTPYYYVLSATNGSGEGENSAQATATTLPLPPSAPTELNVMRGTNRATLSWTSSTGATSYVVKRSITPGGPYSTIATGVTSTTYLDTGLTTGVTYYYVVSASNDDGTGPASYEASVGPGSLRVQLKFDESGGTVAKDSSGGRLHATLVNAPGFSGGKIDNGLNLTAASSQYATLPVGIASGLTDFTISTWVKVTSFANWQRIFDFGTGTDNYMFLTTQYTTGSPNNAKLRFGIRTPSVGEQKVSVTGAAIVAGAWTHVAVTRSGTTVSIYVNGSLAGSGTINLSPANLGATTQNYLGKSQFTDPYLNGSLDDFRIYTQAQSATEIAAYVSPLAAPQNLAATRGPLSLGLGWNAVANATGYTVKYATQSGGPYTTLTSGLPTPGQSHSGLSYGTTYYYVVSATNSAYESPNSAELMATPNSALISAAESVAPGFVITPPSSEDYGIAQMVISNSVVGHTYQLQTSTSLTSGSWENMGDAVLSDGSPIIFETNYDASEPSRFYRVLIDR